MAWKKHWEKKDIASTEKVKDIANAVLETCPVCGSAVGTEETCTQCGAGLDYYRQQAAGTVEETGSESMGHTEDPASE